MERNLFGRLLCIALGKKIDIGEVLRYPLTPVPLSMCHLDGTMASTKKDVLATRLEKMVISLPPPYIDCHVIDGMFFLRTTGEFPIKYGKIAEFILKKICAMKSKRIDLVFDNYRSPSIKDIERAQRSSDKHTKYEISGPEQERPSDMSTALKSVMFKEALVSFLSEHWQCQHLSQVTGNKIIYITSKEKCFSFKNIEGILIRDEEETLKSLQEEADYRVVYHISQLPPPSNVVVRANDTDILVVLLANQGHLPGKSIWMELGLFTTNNLRYVDVSLLANNLGSRLCQSLPGFHAFTGCDYTPSFVCKGKLRPFNLLLKNECAQEALAKLGESEIIDEGCIKGVEKFACCMYGNKAVNSIDDVLVENFLCVYKPKENARRMMGCVKGIDGSSFPPCFRILIQQIFCANYICSIWKNASTPSFDKFSPLQSGWILEDDSYAIKWFDGDKYPSDFEIIAVNNEESDEDDEVISNDDSDSDGDDDDDNGCFIY